MQVLPAGYYAHSLVQGARIVRVAEPILRPVTETQDGALDSSYNLNWFRVYRVS